jgi:hypothetical protein
MAITVTHNKTNTVTDWTQAQLDAQIALGNFAPGTLLADIVLPSDWNDNHTVSGAVESIVAGENITVDNTDPANPVVASSGQSDPNLTILGTGVAGDEFRYNEDVIVQGNLAYSLQDSDIYKTFITDGSTPCDYDFSSVSENFTCKFHVDARNPALIRLINPSIWINGIQYTSEIQSDVPSSGLTVRILSNRLNCQSVTGIWRAL